MWNIIRTSVSFTPNDCNVGPADWRQADDPPHRLRWTGLRP
jgi:hypothetical protein